MLCMRFNDSCPNIQAMYLTETCDKISGSFNPSRTHCSSLFTDPLCTTQKSFSVLVIKMNQVMLFMEIITVCSELITKHRNTLCGQKLDTVNVKTGGIWSNHSRI
jgi:hypothetical protein